LLLLLLLLIFVKIVDNQTPPTCEEALCKIRSTCELFHGKKFLELSPRKHEEGYFNNISTRRVISTTFVAFGAKEKVANNGFHQVHTPPRACPSHAYLSRIGYLYSPSSNTKLDDLCTLWPHNFS